VHRNYRARWPPPWTSAAANGRLKSAHQPRRTARLPPPPNARVARSAPTAEHELDPLPGPGALDSLIRTIPSEADASTAPGRSYGPIQTAGSDSTPRGRSSTASRRAAGVIARVIDVSGSRPSCCFDCGQQVVASLGCRSVERQPHARVLPRSGRSRRQFGKTNTPAVRLNAALSARAHRRGDAAIASAHCPGVARTDFHPGR